MSLAKGMELAKMSDMLDSFEHLMGNEAMQKVSDQIIEKTVPEFSESAKTTFIERVEDAGDPAIVNHLKTLTALGAKFSSSEAITMLVQQGQGITNLLRVNFAAANVFGFGGLAGGGIEIDGPNGQAPINLHIPGLTELYNTHFEDPTTSDGGLSTASADDLVHIASVLSPASIPTFQLVTGTW